MRVLHSVPYSYGAWAYGGIPRLSFHLCEELVKLGVEVDIVTTDALDRGIRRQERAFSQSGVKIRVYRNLSNRLAYDLQLFLPLGLAREKARVKDYRLVHIHGHRNLLNTRISRWAGQAGVPQVLQPNGTLVNIERRRGLKAAYDLLFGNTQVADTRLFIAVSQAEKRQFQKLGIPDEKVRVAPNGVLVENPRPTGSFKEKFGVKGDYILYLGKLTPRKGIESVILALKFLPENISAVIAGNDMGWLQRLNSLARSSGLEPRVVFTGLLVSPWKEAAYREALATVYAGELEIFGLVQFESILCGTPAIVADDCGAGEWVRQSGGGFLVPYGDAGKIAEIVRGLDKSKMDLGPAQEWIRRNLNWAAVARQVKSYYEEVLGSGN